jgi:chromosome partitioning protein
VLPSHPNLSKTNAGMTAASTGELRALLKPIEDSYDFIIVDTPPSESYLSISALVYVKEILVPVETHFLSLQGLKQLFEMVKSIKRGLNQDLKILGILPAKAHNRTNMSTETLKLLRTQFGDLVFPLTIDFTIRHPEASMQGVPLVILNPNHPGAQAYQKLTELILEGEINGR